MEGDMTVHTHRSADAGAARAAARARRRADRIARSNACGTPERPLRVTVNEHQYKLTTIRLEYGPGSAHGGGRAHHDFRALTNAAGAVLSDCPASALDVRPANAAELTQFAAEADQVAHAFKQVSRQSRGRQLG
jgi:hypothetical protein